MQITFTARGNDASRLSYFFGKHPDNPFQRETDYGVVEFKFITYTDHLVKGFIAFHADGLAMVRDSEYRGLEQYISDREFSLSTIFLTNVRRSIGHVLSRDYEHIDTPYEFTVDMGPISTTLPDDAILELFQPMGYEVKIRHVQADYDFEVDSGNVIELELSKVTDMVSLFRQIYVLVPVLDNYKHYPISVDEAEKLLRYGEGWLDTHPRQAFIVKRYVRYKESLIQSVRDQLASDEIAEAEEKKIRLGELRYGEFARRIVDLGIQDVVDMGAGEGRLLHYLVQIPTLKQITACEPTESGLISMHRRLERWKKNDEVKVEPTMIQSSLFYKDERLLHRECMVLSEVIEHIDRDRIDRVMNTLLAYFRPQYLLLSTPNVEYNQVYNMDGAMRHTDHRFEMTRGEFLEFIAFHASEQGYLYEIVGVGDEHPEYGQPSQMAILRRG